MVEFTLKHTLKVNRLFQQMEDALAVN